METVSGQADVLTQSVIRCILTVHHTLGPGFLENIYRRALVIELNRHRLITEVEKEVSIHYRGVEVGRHRMDIVVENALILELKTVETIGKAHYTQVRSYLRATGYADALLINFGDSRVDFRRIPNPTSSP